MQTYINIANFINNLCGQEFVTQLLMVFLLFIGLPKRKLFILRYLLSIAFIVGAGWFFSKVVLIVPYEYVIFFAFIVLATFLCFKENLLQSLFIGVLIYSLQHVLSCASYALTMIIAFDGVNWERFFQLFSSVYFIVMPLMSAIICVLTHFFIVRPIKEKETLRFNNAAVIFAATLLIISAVFLTHYAQQETTWSIKSQIYIRLLSLLLSSTIVAYLLGTLKTKELQNENKILQILLQKDKQQYLLAKRSGEKIQMKYHDILKRNTDQGIVNYEELREIDDDKEVLFTTFFTGNRALDIILSEKALESERAGIRFICTADGSAVDFMKSYHIYSLIGNALENAIEYLNSYDRKDVKEVEASITKQHNICVIKVSNYAENVVIAEDGLPKTTKQDEENHGYGLKSMKNVAELYGGDMSVTFKDNTFVVKVAIPIKEK